MSALISSTQSLAQGIQSVDVSWQRIPNPMPPQRTYLDNAATSWPKPESVYAAVDRYQREVGVAAGRGSYREAEEVNRSLVRTRLNFAKLIHAHTVSECIFTFSCTDSLNQAIHGVLQPHDHVITSVAEHNSILRPLQLWQSKGVEVTSLPLQDGAISPDAVHKALRPNTKLVAITHASNVTGWRQPVEAIADVLSEHPTLLLLDAAQTLGHEKIDVQALPVDLLAAPGHKGALGPLGTGLLYVRQAVAETLQPFRQGGTGTESERIEQPTALPDKFESGNHNVPGLIGLDAGLQYVLENRLDESTHLKTLAAALIDGLAAIDGVQIYSKPNDFGIVSFNVEGFPPQELATALDSMAQIQLRAGLHCAPLMHQAIGTVEQGGTVRASFGHASTEQCALRLVEAVQLLQGS